MSDILKSDVACLKAEEDDASPLDNNIEPEVGEENEVKLNTLTEGDVVAGIPEKPHSKSCTYWMTELAS